MVTALQLLDLDRFTRQLNPNGDVLEEYLTLTKSLPMGGVAAIGGSEISSLATDFVIFNNSAPGDTGLESSNLVVGGKYLVDLTLLVTGVSINPDLRLNFVSSAGSTFKWTLGLLNDASAAINTIGSVPEPAVGALTGLIKATGILEIVTTVGTIKVQASQRLAQSENTIVKIGSKLKITRIS